MDTPQRALACTTKCLSYVKGNLSTPLSLHILKTTTPCLRGFSGALALAPLVNETTLERRGFASFAARRALDEGRRWVATTATTSARADRVHAIKLSDACVRRIRQLAEEDGAERRLRVSVEAGGCSGYQYKFEWESPDDAEDSDVVVDRDGAIVVVDRVSLEFLRGATVDFEEELIRSSFTIVDNPNSESGCGCGSSFNAKE
ncbi:iron-sulfur cluster assembly accessory protein [Pycnococcus provasolii]